MFTWLEIDEKAIQHNIKQFRRIIGKDTLLMPVIKANAYGHGFFEVAKICEKSADVDRICVVNSDEALKLIHRGVKKPIMILGFFDFDEKVLLKLAKKGVIFPLYTLKQAAALTKAGGGLNRHLTAHLKIDTGASRIGILPSEIKKFVHGIKKYKKLKIEGVWSHFASSEDDAEYTEKQYNNFNRSLKILAEEGINPPIKHMSCSAATVVFKLDGLNAVRIGLGIYGLHSSEMSKNKIDLMPALSWYTKVIQIKNIPSGTKIGYGCAYITKRTTKLAIIPIGYWDGYDRRLSNKAIVLIKGTKCGVVGRICMNLTIVDITDAPQIGIGEKATLIGKDGQNKITADDIAGWTDTINYEIVDRINPLLPRIIQ